MWEPFSHSLQPSLAGQSTGLPTWSPLNSCLKGGERTIQDIDPISRRLKEAEQKIRSYGNATSVREVTMDEMLQQSQFVLEGTVTAIEARENSQERIHSYVTFEITDIIKGEYNSNIITLRFLGGTVDDVTLVVSDMRLPQEGEHGIYFVESLERFQVNPLYGWSQGHFIVELEGAGRERVMTNRRLPVTGVMDDKSDEPTTHGKERIQTLSRGVVRDLVVAQEGEDNKGMTVDEFKTVLHKRMGRNQ